MSSRVNSPHHIDSPYTIFDDLYKRFVDGSSRSRVDRCNAAVRHESEGRNLLTGQIDFCEFLQIPVVDRCKSAYSYYYNNFDFWHRLPNDDDNDAHAQCDDIVSRTKAIGNRMKEKKTSKLVFNNVLLLHRIRWAYNNNNNNTYSGGGRAYIYRVGVITYCCISYIYMCGSRNPFVYYTRIYHYNGSPRGGWWRVRRPIVMCYYYIIV
jgi:hypothetical protein